MEDGYIYGDSTVAGGRPSHDNDTIMIDTTGRATENQRDIQFEQYEVQSEEEKHEAENRR